MMKLPLRILSDLHLGHRASRINHAEQLRPLFTGMGTVIFNGDTWEPLAPPWREKSANMLADLKRILAEEGCDVIFLRGNHDPEWDGPACISLAGGKIAITHGDALLRDSSPWKHEVLGAADVVERIWSKHPTAETQLDSRLEVAREIAETLPSKRHLEGRTLLSRALDAAFPPRRTLAMLSAWMFQAKHGARFCETYLPEAELLVIGHFHRTAIRQTRGRTLLNIGSFVVPGSAAYIGWDGEILTYGMISESKERFRAVEAKRQWRVG